MSLLTESTQTGLASSLTQGLGQLSNNQTLVFRRYVKQTFAQDGYVFWVLAGQTLEVTGSLHYATTQEQEEDQTLGMNSVIFTAEQEVEAFNAVNSQTLWVANWQTPGGNTIQIAFSRHGPYYDEANLWHYFGFAVYPALASQLVASSSDLPTGPIVNNSLPIWLSLPTELATVPGGYAPVVSVYASFLVPDNIVPPYIVAHVESTRPAGSFPILLWPGNPSPTTALQVMSSSQLMQDMVRLTFYGLNEQQATQWYVALIEYSKYTDAFGFQNSPAFQDDKRTQSEITAIAMKKTMLLKASYYQSAADALARRLILSAALGSVTVS